MHSYSLTVDPYLIVGLGNPGSEYRCHRHNVGFVVLDRLAVEYDLTFSRHKPKSMLAKGTILGQTVILAKPLTFMNLVGKAVAPLVRTHQIQLDHILLICDDLDLPSGTLRVRPSGGSGGHKGLRSIIETIGTSDIPRLRIGIGRPPGRMDPADYVLEDFSALELRIMDPAFTRAMNCVEIHLGYGIQEAMNRFNTEPE